MYKCFIHNAETVIFISKVEFLCGFVNLFVDIKAGIMVINFTLNIIPEDLLAIKRKRKSKLRDINSTYLCITFSVIFPEKLEFSVKEMRKYFPLARIIKSIIVIAKIRYICCTFFMLQRLLRNKLKKSF